MKKLFSLALAILVAFSMVGCGDKKADNKYVESAKKYGYWYGLGGISWGMSIDEMLSVLGVKREDTITASSDEDTERNLTTIESFSVDSKIFGLPANLKFTFNKAKSDDAGVLAKTEWLTAISVTFKGSQTVDGITAILEKEAKATNASYDIKKLEWSNKQTFNTISDKQQSNKAYALFQKLLEPSTTPISPSAEESTIETIRINVDNDYNVYGLTIAGYPAAMLALA